MEVVTEPNSTLFADLGVDENLLAPSEAFRASASAIRFLLALGNVATALCSSCLRLPVVASTAFF